MENLWLTFVNEGCHAIVLVGNAREEAMAVNMIETFTPWLHSHTEVTWGMDIPYSDSLPARQRGMCLMGSCFEKFQYKCSMN